MNNGINCSNAHVFAGAAPDCSDNAVYKSGNQNSDRTDRRAPGCTAEKLNPYGTGECVPGCTTERHALGGMSMWDFEHAKYWIEKKCPVCGKIFYPPSDEWGYKENGAFICSWHCLCRLRRGAAETMLRICRRSGRAAVPRLSAAQREKRNANIRDDFARGASVGTLECRYGLSYTHIKRILKAAPAGSESKAAGASAECRGRQARVKRPDTSKAAAESLAHGADKPLSRTSRSRNTDSAGKPQSSGAGKPLSETCRSTCAGSEAKSQGSGAGKPLSRTSRSADTGSAPAKSARKRAGAAGSLTGGSSHGNSIL